MIDAHIVFIIQALIIVTTARCLVAMLDTRELPVLLAIKNKILGQSKPVVDDSNQYLCYVRDFSCIYKINDEIVSFDKAKEMIGPSFANWMNRTFNFHNTINMRDGDDLVATFPAHSGESNLPVGSTLTVTARYLGLWSKPERDVNDLHFECNRNGLPPVQLSLDAAKEVFGQFYVDRMIRQFMQNTVGVGSYARMRCPPQLKHPNNLEIELVYKRTLPQQEIDAQQSITDAIDKYANMMAVGKMAND